MKAPIHVTRAALALVAPLLFACTAEEPTPGDPNVEEQPDTEDPLATWDDARPIIERRCARCHTADRLSTYRRLETHQEVSALRGRILEKIETDPDRGQQMPIASNHDGAAGCTPAHTPLNDKRLTDAEAEVLIAYLNREDHREVVDTFEPLSAPAITALADAVEYPSSQFDVINDGFITHPDADKHGYMHQYGYDERDFDQMEDDWFCIVFDPMRTEPGYLTGVQTTLGLGQIYLNSQLVIDTTGASADARAAAKERGPDWYRCDGGLGFADAIPLWRTVPGGEAIELPEGTGLRFEPGWTFVLRADFHTHYDADEFNALNQNGVIDYDEGTMTWFNQLSLRARWATPADISRELKWIAVGPQTPAERDRFTVARGESTLTYSATIPTEGDGKKQYAIFSAEVGMGKLGHTATLVDSSNGTCVTSNADFSPKWIEQVIYGEGDAPSLEPGSTLDLNCMYRNGDEDVGFGQESEATVWGRKEMCQAVVYYYERN